MQLQAANPIANKLRLYVDMKGGVNLTKEAGSKIFCAICFSLWRTSKRTLVYSMDLYSGTISALMNSRSLNQKVTNIGELLRPLATYT